MQNAVDAVTDAQFVFGRFKVNVRRAVFEGFPDDLVDEFDDAGFLVAFGNFLVRRQAIPAARRRWTFRQGFRRRRRNIFSAPSRFRPWASSAKSHGRASVELDSTEHGRIKRIADGDMKLAVFELDRQNGELECDLG